MLNCAVIMGRLTADPELRQTPSGVSVTRFTVAVDRGYVKAGEERKADFINVVAWRQTAEFVTRYFRKASSICVVGSIQTRSWTDNQGNKRFATEVVADEAMFVDAKSESPAAVQQAAAAFSQHAPAASYMPEGYSSYGAEAAPAFGAASAPKFEEITDDDELPF